jgi:Ca2+-binding RTX toxin-like protein
LVFVFTLLLAGGLVVVAAQGNGSSVISAQAGPAQVVLAGETIQVQSVPPNLACGESAVITATVRDVNGVPIQGAQLNLSSNAGTVVPSSGQTAADGSIAAFYTAPGSSVTARVTAGLAGSNPSVSGFVDISVTCGGTTVMCQGLPATIVGTERDDVIQGTPGRDVIASLGGNDQINAFGGDDTLCGGDGNDLLLGFGGDDTLVGGPGDDRLHGMDGDDTISGGGGDDGITGGDGFDVCDGGGGTSFIGFCEAAPEGFTCKGEVVTVLGGPGNDGLVGTPGRDIIDGRGGNDIIQSLGGNDVICGGAGNDWLMGYEGNDTLLGGPGRDICSGGSGTDTTNACEFIYEP